MTKEFCTYEQALALKELGFDEPCFGRWIEPTELSISAPSDDEYCLQQHEFSWTALAPLYQQAFRWFREKHKMNSGIIPHYDYFYFIIKDFSGGKEYYSDDTIELTYKEAEQACLDKLIEICKTK